jgi:hypothetical protein
MFGSIQAVWQEARAARLKKEFLDASRRMHSFTEENAKHFATTLDYAFRFWIKNHGPMSESPVEFRRSAVKELKTQAKHHYDSDIGRSYGLAVFAFHIESSTLPGDDAKYVYDVTALSISSASQLVKSLESKR